MTLPSATLVSELSKAILGRQNAERSQSDGPTALVFRFPFPGPWGEGFTEHARGLAADIAAEPGLRWKLWLEDRENGHAGGIYLFEDAATAERYRAKHERRLAATGLTAVTAHAFQVNAELSALTLAGAALGGTSKLGHWQRS